MSLTAEDLTEAIAAAIRARDLNAVTDLLFALAAVDPHRAQEVYDTIQAGLAVAEREREREMRPPGT